MPVEHPLLYNDILASLSTADRALLDADNHLDDAAFGYVTQANQALQAKLEEQSPFKNDKARLVASQSALGATDKGMQAFDQALSHYQLFANKAAIDSDAAYWLNEQQSLHTSTKKMDHKQAASKLLLQQWQQQLESAIASWRQSIYDTAKDQTVAHLKQWCKNIETIKQCAEQLCVSPGSMIGGSEHQFGPQNLDEIKKWAHYMKHNKEVRKICDMLGRLRAMERAERMEEVRELEGFTHYVPDPQGREEIIGIKPAKDIQYVTPTELALLSDDDTSLVFDMKYVESRLMCFDMQGYQAEHNQREIPVTHSVEDDDEQGPIILAVDTSGSMCGDPETIAKAITLSIASKAREQQRRCYLITFSDRIKKTDLSYDMGIKGLMNFLQSGFGGCTDVEPALEAGIKMMKKDDYNKADLLVISDFVIKELDNSITRNMNNLRESGNAFYALSIGWKIHDQHLAAFDKQWHFDSTSESLQQLNDIRKKFTR